MVYTVQVCWLRVKNFLIMLTNAFRTASEKLIQKTAEATSESLGNKIGSKTTKV